VKKCLFAVVMGCFAGVFSVGAEKFFVLQASHSQYGYGGWVKIFEKIFCRNGKWLYLCTRFRRERGYVEKCVESASALKRMRR